MAGGCGGSASALRLPSVSGFRLLVQRHQLSSSPPLWILVVSSLTHRKKAVTSLMFLINTISRYTGKAAIQAEARNNTHARRRHWVWPAAAVVRRARSDCPPSVGFVSWFSGTSSARRHFFGFSSSRLTSPFGDFSGFSSSRLTSPFGDFSGFSSSRLTASFQVHVSIALA